VSVRRRSVLAALLIGCLCALGAAPGRPPSQGGRSQALSEVARAHLEEIASVLEANWLRRDTMDWRHFRESVLREAEAAQTIHDTYPAIRLALRLLGDRHSYYVPADGPVIFNPDSPSQSTRQCDSTDPAAPELPTDIGYLWVHIADAVAGAERITKAIAARTSRPTSKWIVDLRNSRGGNMWPILAALGPVLGEGPAGYFGDSTGTLRPWGYTKGEAWLDGQTIAVAESPATSSTGTPRVAVLTDVGVVSSGEAIAIAFRGRPNTRSFGTATCGLSTGVNQIPLKSGGRLAVVTSVMMDRDKHAYGGVVDPDVPIADRTAAVRAAVEWLSRSRQERR
jgi:carboxyl-terminal processing protease